MLTKLRVVIKNDIGNNLFSLKIDSATCLVRNIFGISIQYCKNGNIVSRLIGMSQLKGAGCTKSKNLAGEIIKTLTKYDLNIQQVIAITSDNGANMLKATSLLSHCLEKSNEEEILENDDYLNLLEEIENDQDFKIEGISICRCAAHTAQLVAIDVLKQLSLKNVVLKTRNLVKLLRKSSSGYRSLFEVNQIRIPQIDCLTRWRSTYKMISEVKSTITT